MLNYSRFLLLVLITSFTGCKEIAHFPWKGDSVLEQVRQSGTLKVLTRYNPTTYYEGPEGFTGLEYDLVQLFAKRLGVKVEYIIPDTFDDILTRISNNKAHIAAAGLTITGKRRESMRFSYPYRRITEQLIYRSGTKRPRKISELTDGILEVVKGSSHLGTLMELKKKVPDLEWNVNPELDTDALLFLVNEGLIDYTIANSNQVLLIRRFYPKLYVAFDISSRRSLAWALPKSNDTSLYDETIKFFMSIKQDRTLAQLIERHYGPAGSLNYVGNCTFRRHVIRRLPEFKQHFQHAAEIYDIDWRLLAAMGYQESHWHKQAVSPTGVRGIMMLTENTARHLGIKDRNNPVQSIIGGARYFMQRKQRIPKHIPQPDHTWMALAAYNVGHGHLEDARILTKMRGENPDKWIDVKKSLPLLADKKWYSKTKHGYARGREPVVYVENIRNYYDLLIWLTEGDSIQKNVMNIKVKDPPIEGIRGLLTPFLEWRIPLP